MTEYDLAWTTPDGQEMSLAWYDTSDATALFLLATLRGAGATITRATIKSSVTTDLLAVPESRPAHPPTD